MTPKLLKTFLAVAEMGNMSLAAGRLHLVQSSVSDQIQMLEDQLGVILFDRLRTGVTLTAPGLTLKVYAEAILATIDEATAAVGREAGSQRPTVVVGALETIAARWLPDLFSRFRDEHADIDLQLRVAGTSELVRTVRSGETDAIFCFEFDDPAQTLASRTVAREPLVLIGPAGAPAGQVRGFVVTQKGCVFRRIFDENIGAFQQGSPEILAEVDSIAAIVRLVAGGGGRALVPRMAVHDALERGEVRQTDPGQPDIAARMSLVWRRRRIQPPGLHRVLASLASDQAVTPVAM